MLLIVFFIAIAISFPLHKFLRNFAAACIATAVLCTALAWVIAPQHFGWLDKTFYENVFIFGLTSLGAAIGVGLWMKRRGR